MTTNTNATNFRSGDRVRFKGFRGTFVKYYAPSSTGKRRVDVLWDDRSLVMTPLEIQIEAI